MDIQRNYRLTTSFHSSCVLPVFTCLLPVLSFTKEFQVRVILNIRSWNGKMVHSGITMVASDFYYLNAHYKTKFVPQTSDSKSILLSVLEYYVPTNSTF